MGAPALVPPAWGLGYVVCTHPIVFMVLGLVASPLADVVPPSDELLHSSSYPEGSR